MTYSEMEHRELHPGCEAVVVGDLLFDHCSIAGNNGFGITLHPNPQCLIENISISNCVFETNNGGSISLSAEYCTFVNNIRILGCTFTHQTFRAIIIATPSSGVISDCAFEHSENSVPTSDSLVKLLGIPEVEGRPRPPGHDDFGDGSDIFFQPTVFTGSRTWRILGNHFVRPLRWDNTPETFGGRTTDADDRGIVARDLGPRVVQRWSIYVDDDIDSHLVVTGNHFDALLLGEYPAAYFDVDTPNDTWFIRRAGTIVEGLNLFTVPVETLRTGGQIPRFEDKRKK